MDYTIYRRSNQQPLDTLSMHVFARALRSAWHVLYTCDPVGKHTIASMDLVIEFATGGCHTKVAPKDWN